MRILRSQYLKLQSNAAPNGSNNKGKRHPINDPLSPSKGQHSLTTINTRLSTATNSIQRRRTSLSFLNTSHDPVGTRIKILFENLDCPLDKLNVIVEFTDMSTQWLTQLFKSFENELWHRKPRVYGFGKATKWLFYCTFCENVYRNFSSIKSHVNLHLDFYPYVCKLCCMKYTNRKSATTHLRRMHNVERDDWDDYLTS